MGRCELPSFIKTSHCIIGLDKDKYGNLNTDSLCGLRCLAFHCSLKETKDGYRGLEARTKNSNNSGNKVDWTFYMCQNLKTLSTFLSKFTLYVKMDLSFHAISVRNCMPKDGA